MLQARPFQPNQDSTLLKQYKKINSSLRRKLKEKDNRIQLLFGYIQDAGLSFPAQDPHGLTHELSKKIARSESKRKEKEERSSQYLEQGNIFKQPSSTLIQRISRPDIHLPFLEKRSRNIFQQQDPIVESLDKKSKLVKISLEKLKPLNPEQVKKRFLMKYQKPDITNE